MGCALIQLCEHLLDLLPAAPYALGISGHADSTALLRLMRQHRPDCPLHLVHLEHELRGDESAGDARFVADLAGRMGLPLTLESRRRMEEAGGEALAARAPGNPSARWRALRHELYLQVVREHGLAGVLLAHHADDQAETVVQRMLRGSSVLGLCGMAFVTDIGGLRIFRPLLPLRKTQLLTYLREIGQPWREDSSNADTAYQRNRVRQFLAGEPELFEPLLELAQACAELRGAVQSVAPKLEAEFACAKLGDAPEILAAEAARRWLLDRGVPAGELLPGVLERLVEMATDAAAPARQDFPGGVVVRRRRGRISGRPGDESRQPATSR
jgi:tRNA(Ile)-lysidine synthase